MDKVHEVGWCMAAALKAAQRASKSSWSLACSSCFPVWFSAELLDEGCSFSDLLCMLRSASRSLGQGQMKADIASIVSLLTQQPRALQKHARLFVRMQKRILGQRPAVGIHCTMLNTQTSHAQRLKWQICSLWSFILMNVSLYCDFSLTSCDGKSVAHSSSAPFPDIAAVSELVGSCVKLKDKGLRDIQKIFRASLLDKYVYIN